MSEIKFYAPETPDFEQANMLAKLAMEQRQKASEGFKNTVKSFTDSVVKANHSLIKERLDALTPEQLQDKVAVNALVNKLTKDTGYMYDAPVIDTYVEARPDILQQRALEAEKLKQQELANQNSAFNLRNAQMDKNKQARDELRQDLLSQFTHYIGKGDTDTTLKLLQKGKDLFPSSEEMQAFLHHGLDKYTNDHEMDALKKAQLQAQTNALLTQANVAQQNADTNAFKAVNDNRNTQTDQELRAYDIATKGSGGGNGGNGKDSNGKDKLQQANIENAVKRLNEIGYSNGVIPKDDGSFDVNYNTVNSTVQNNISNISKKYHETTGEWEEKILSSKELQSVGTAINRTKAEELKVFVDNYKTTDDNGNERLLRPDEKEELYRKAVLGDISFANWTRWGEGDTLNSKKIEPYLTRYNNEITKKANAEITAHIADTLSALSQATGKNNGEIAYALGWGIGSDMFKQLPESLQKDLVKYDTQQNTKRLLGGSPMTGTNGNMLNTAVNQSKNRKVTVNGKDWLVPSSIAKPTNDKPYADMPLGKYRNRFNH